MILSKKQLQTGDLATSNTVLKKLSTKWVTLCNNFPNSKTESIFVKKKKNTVIPIVNTMMISWFTG